MTIVKLEGSLPNSLREVYKEFMCFDACEAQIARLYEPRSIYVFVMDGYSILGTVSMITKRFSFERLPCEFSCIDQSKFNFSLSKDDLPATEMGYLRINESLRLRLRTYILKTLCDAMCCQWYQSAAKIVLLSCRPDQNLERLYNRFYRFERIATISYESEPYTLMARHKPITIASTSYEGEYNAEKQTTFA